MNPHNLLLFWPHVNMYGCVIVCRAIDDVSQSPNRAENNSSSSLALSTSTSSPRASSAVLLSGLEKLQVGPDTLPYFCQSLNTLNGMISFSLHSSSPSPGFSVPKWPSCTWQPSDFGFSPPADSSLSDQGPFPWRHLLRFYSHVSGHARDCFPNPAAPAWTHVQLGALTSFCSPDRQHGLCCICPAPTHLATHSKQQQVSFIK